MRPDFSWLRLPAAFDGAGRPIHRHGVAVNEPGLGFLGMPYQRTLASRLLGGVGADARVVVRQLLGAAIR